MLVIFKSTAAPEIVMLQDLAHYLLGVIGKHLGERGVITHQEMPEAMQRLQEAIENERKADAAQIAHVELGTDNHDEKEERHISLAQRAFPLLDMMRVAYKHEAEILWGV